jgi:hypothetical protein
VAQHYPCLEHYAKQPSGQWLLTIESSVTGSMFIASINGRFPLVEVYKWINFASSGAPADRIVV